MRKPAHSRRQFLALLLGLILVCAISLPSPAQRYSFREYTEGLGNLNIDCLVQDHTGYLWVGTQNGLYRYDGSRFQSFGPAEGLPERMIQNLFVSSDGTLWVATTTGIFFERKDGRFSPVTSSGPVSQFLQQAGSVFTARDADRVVTVTRSGAFQLRRTDGGQWVAEKMPLEGSSLWSVQYAPDGALWYGCDSDLCRLAGGKTTRLRDTLKLPEEHWTNLLFSHDGHLWIRGSHHVGEIDPATGSFQLREVPAATGSEAYPGLVEDAKGRILTSRGSSLALWDGDHWRMVTEHNGLSRFEIQAIFVDREGSLWIGVVGHGLLRWVGQDRWEGYTAADGLSDDLVWSVMRDRGGRLWIGTESGLNFIPPGEVNPKEWRQPGIVTSRSGALAESSDGAVWVASAAGALVRIAPKTWSGMQWKLPEAYNLAVDRNDHVWVATNGGLYEADAASNRGPQLVEAATFGDIHQRFSDLASDASGRVWAAADNGIFLHDESGWHRIDTGNSAIKPDLIAVDDQGWLWAAGASQDLMRLRVKGYQVTETQRIASPPLLSEEVVSLLIDHMGWVWVGQDKGISVFDGKTWHSYTQDDGLIWNDTDSFALAEDTNGSIWVGTSGGLGHLITPGYLATEAPQAPVLSQVSYRASAIRNGASLKWSPTSSLDISVALLSFKGTEDSSIRYRLVGSQASEWETTRDMEIHYQHIGPGNYRFEVAQADLSGNAVSPVAAISFNILPLWWQNRYFQAALALLLLALIIALWRRRVGHLLHQKRQLEDAVKQRTTDLEREKNELMRTREQMRHYAEHDDLTGLWNHRIVVDRLRIEVERSRREGLPLSVILADLDFFKRINDTYGHPAGDRVLKEASAIFKKMVRSYDWVGRYGGEEFLLIMPGSGFMSTRQRAEELRQAIETLRVEDNGNMIPITASFGVACGFPADHEELIRIADAALYRAKRNGRNCVVTTEVDVRVDSAQQAENELTR